MASGLQALLNLQQVNDAHAGIVPAIPGPNLVLISNDDGDAVDWLDLADFTTGPTGPTGATGPAGADGVMNAPADPGENGCIPHGASGDLAYSADLVWSGGVLSVAGQVYVTEVVGEASTPGLHLDNSEAALVGVQVQRSPALRFTGTAWDTDDSLSRAANMHLQLVPVAANVPSWELCVFGNAAGDELALSIGQAGPEGGTTLPNFTPLSARNFADNGDILIAMVDDNNHVRIGGAYLYDPDTNGRHYDGGTPVGVPSAAGMADLAAVKAALVAVGIFQA
jgi:hypothetical protein